CPTSTLFPYTTLFRSFDQQLPRLATQVVPRFLRHVHLDPGQVERGVLELVAPREIAAERCLRARPHEIRPLHDIRNGLALLEDRSEEHTSELQSRENL